MRQTRATIDALLAMAFVVIVIDASDTFGFSTCFYIHILSPYNFARIQEQIAHSSPSTSFQSLIVILLPPLIPDYPAERSGIDAAMGSVHLIEHRLKGQYLLLGERTVFVYLHCMPPFQTTSTTFPSCTTRVSPTRTLRVIKMGFSLNITQLELLCTKS